MSIKYLKLFTEYWHLFGIKHTHRLVLWHLPVMLSIKQVTRYNCADVKFHIKTAIRIKFIHVNFPPRFKHKALLFKYQYMQAIYTYRNPPLWNASPWQQVPIILWLQIEDEVTQEIHVGERSILSQIILCHQIVKLLIRHVNSIPDQNIWKRKQMYSIHASTRICYTCYYNTVYYQSKHACIFV